MFKSTTIGLADSDPNLSMKYSVSLSSSLYIVGGVGYVLRVPFYLSFVLCLTARFCAACGSNVPFLATEMAS